MADVAASVGASKTTVISVLVALLIAFLLMWVYKTYVSPSAPSATALSAAQYGALSATEQALWKIDPAGSGYYVHA